LIAACLLAAAPAHAAPLALSLSTDGGFVEAGAAGVVRDDARLTLRLMIGAGRFTALTVGADADLERLELALRTGALLRPFCARVSPYVRAELAVIGTAHIGRVWELTGGVGLWWRLHARVAAFVEVDAVGRVGEVRSLAEHFAVGLALTSPRFIP
jgi:hypothetical protein